MGNAPDAAILDLPVKGKVKRDLRHDGGRDADRRTRRGGRHDHQDSAVLRRARAAAPGRTHTGRLPRLHPDAVSRIDFVHRGQAAGLTLAQIKQILDIRDHGQAPCGHVRDLLDARLADIDAQIADLTTLRDNVAALRDDAALPEPETCSPDQVCRYL
ncbi:hypothetical protein MKOR_17720 [Mycolicibacillus koreensis]|nr:hypothetical protein MKOR_17720 [Mycolicibacillus koreensis]